MGMGYNPYTLNKFKATTRNYTIGGIIKKMSDNVTIIDDTAVIEGTDTPLININGKLKTYQRGYVWSIEQKISLILSIINGVGCGYIIIREVDYDEITSRIESGEREGLAFYELVDGKQRVNAIKSFIQNEFKVNGFYFGEWEKSARLKFMNSNVFSTYELSSNCSREDGLRHFLMFNDFGVKQDPTHMDTVRSWVK